MDIQKTKAKRKTLPCIISTKENPECCRFFPLSSPSPGRRGSFLIIHYSNTWTDFVSCCWEHYVRAFHASCFISAVPSLPDILPLGFSSTLTFCSVWKSEWENLPLAWADHFLSAGSPWWSWQSYHTCTVKWNRWHRGRWGSRTPFLASVDVWAWALKAEGILFVPRLALIQGRVSLSETQEARELPCTYSMKLFLVFHWN